MDKNIRNYFIPLLVCGLILWPSLDYCTSLLTEELFEYSVYDHILEPVVFAFLMTLVFMFNLNKFQCQIESAKKGKTKKTATKSKTKKK